MRSTGGMVLKKQAKALKTGRGRVSIAQYRKLAEMRYRIRRFIHFSEEAARSIGLEPQQHQLMLAIKGLRAGVKPTISAVSEKLCLRHHSTVELIDRLER